MTTPVGLPTLDEAGPARPPFSDMVLAVIPARGGSKGLAGKNIKPFAGLPLIAHSILFARLCPEIDRLVVSTDSAEIAEVARHFGADVPFVRPAELAGDDTPMWPVLRHALATVEAAEGRSYDFLMLLDPTSPARTPADVTAALGRLAATPTADGILAVSEPDFSPIWHTVVERDGWMADFVDHSSTYTRRQDVPIVYRVTGALYVWRASFVRETTGDWRKQGRHLMHEIPDLWAMSLDTAEEFDRAEVLVKSGLIRLPWLSGPDASGNT